MNGKTQLAIQYAFMQAHVYIDIHEMKKIDSDVATSTYQVCHGMHVKCCVHAKGGLDTQHLFYANTSLST